MRFSHSTWIRLRGEAHYQPPLDLPLDAAILTDLAQGPLELEVRTEQPIASLLGEGSLMRGSIDRLVLMRRDGKLLAADIIDFKTDSLTADYAARRAELYKEQVNLYARAAGAILNKQIIGKYLYFLKPARTIAID